MNSLIIAAIWLTLGLASLFWFWYGARKADLTITDVLSYIVLKRTEVDQPTVSPSVVFCTCLVLVLCGPISGIIQLGDLIKKRK